MRRVFASSALVLILLTSTALAAKTPEERIGSLEQQIQTIQNTYMSNNASVASAIASSQTVRDEWTSIRGEVESNRHLIKSQYGELSRQIAELDHRIQSIEDRLTIFSSQLSKALGKVSPQVAAEGDLYQKGLDLVNEAKYLEAAAAFESFLRNYPKSSFAASAEAWVGECFYSMRDYQRAIKEYQRFLDDYPRDKNVSTAVLKQGNSFYELGMLEEAKAFYQKVIQSYPSSGAAAESQAKLELIKNREQNASGAPAGQFGSYPAETLEQRQQRMKGAAAAPEPPPAKKPAKAPSPVRDF